jgi:hypothetical protein
MAIQRTFDFPKAPKGASARWKKNRPIIRYHKSRPPPGWTLPDFLRPRGLIQNLSAAKAALRIRNVIYKAGFKPNAVAMAHIRTLPLDASSGGRAAVAKRACSIAGNLTPSGRTARRWVIAQLEATCREGAESRRFGRRR